MPVTINGSSGLTANNGSVFTDSNGNVGVGVSTSATSGSRRVLQIAGGSSGGMIMLGNAGTENPNPRIFLESTNDLGFASGVTTGVMKFYTNDTERMRIRSDGGITSQPTGGGTLLEQFGCRAWVKFNAQGTPALNGSGNVTSVTKQSTGNYTINFTTAMPDTNYSVVGSKANISATHVLPGVNVYANGASNTTMQVYDSGGTFQDSSQNFVAVFR
jgi:hypothetical protein